MDKWGRIVLGGKVKKKEFRVKINNVDTYISNFGHGYIDICALCAQHIS